MDQSNLAVVAENLRRWQDNLWMERRDDMGPEIAAIFQQEALAAAIEMGHSEAEHGRARREAAEQQAARSRRQEELEALYGEAVLQVPGAEPQDLVLLDEIGALLLELDEDARPSYFQAKLLGGTYLNKIRKGSVPPR